MRNENDINESLNPEVPFDNEAECTAPDIQELHEDICKSNECAPMASEPCESDDASEKKDTFTPASRYESALYSVYKNPTLCEGLRILCTAIVLLTAYAYAFVAVTSISLSAFGDVIKLLISTAPAFIIVSAARKIINAPRPYELLPFYEVAPKNKRAESFPSRHVFSVFAIGSAILFLNAPLGACLLGAGVILAASRVLLGIHFIKDTVAGALIGLLSGIGGMLISGIFF